MEHPALRHRGFNHLPNEIQLNILHRIDDTSWLFIQRVRSALPELKEILPVPPPHQYRDLVLPFFNNNEDVLFEAVLRTYDVFNFRDGGWIGQVKYNFQEVGQEVSRFVRLMHPCTNLHFEPQIVPPRIFDSVRYDTIELPSSYRLTASVNGEVFRKIAFRHESIWSVLKDFMILMIWQQGRLALYKSMDQTWGVIQHFCVDVICFARKFYALENTGRTFMVYADRTTAEVAGPIVGVNGHNKRLVESGGHLVLVDQVYSNPNVENVNERRTTRFIVFRFVEEEHIWVRIHTLGEHVLFVGYFNCFSAAVVDVAGARRDLIYFSEAFAVDPDNKDEDEDEDEDEDGNDGNEDEDEDEDEDENEDEDEDGNDGNEAEDDDEDEDEDGNDGNEAEDDDEDGNDGNEDEKEDIHGPGSKEGIEDEDGDCNDGNEDEKEDIHGAGSREGNEDEGEDDNEVKEGREDVAFFDMVDDSITELRRPGGAQYAACFWPPPAWTAAV